MSLLEDVFLEDEAGEAQDLERIIEGDEYDERRPSTPNSNENSEKEDEAEEDRRHVDASSAKPKRIVKNPRVILNPVRLTGPRGIQVVPEHFKDFKFKGKGHEKEDLDLVLKKLEHWAYRLYPKFEFKDCLKKIETLGNKRPVMVHLTKIRTDQFTSEETVVQRDSSEDEMVPEPIEDEFDKLLQQQIELARATPAPGTVKKGFTTPTVEKFVTIPKVASSPSINDEQRERMIRNRQLAEERRLARLKLNNLGNTQVNNSISNTGINTELEEPTNNTLHGDSRDNNMSKNGKNIEENESDTDTTRNNSRLAAVAVNKETNESINGKNLLQDAEENIARVKSNRSNVIDSSDSEDDGLILNESVTVDIHNHRNYDSDEGIDNVQETENENRNTDMAYQNANDEETNSGIEEVRDSQIYNETQQNEQDKKINLDTGHQTENAAENIRNDTNDVVMHEMNSVNESRNGNNVELAGHVKEITTNKKKPEILQHEDNSAVSQISESTDNLRDATNPSNEEAKQNKETTIAVVEEIMDIDFSDDF